MDAENAGSYQRNGIWHVDKSIHGATNLPRH